MNTSRHRATSTIFGNVHLYWRIQPKVKIGGSVVMSAKVPLEYYPSGITPRNGVGFAMLISDCWRIG